MPTILHITTHMGGGVGKVLSGISCYTKIQHYSYNHRILLLEEPKNSEFFDYCKKCDIPISITDNPDDIRREMETADIVQLEWWHHPKMAEFLHMFPKIPVRLVIWSHISGCNYPYLSPEFILKPHRFLVSSKYSLDNPNWSGALRSEIIRRTKIINSSGDFSSFTTRSLVPHKHFTIGYLGTLSYSKLHPKFLDFCSEVTISDSRFIMLGDIPNPNLIKTEAENRGIAERLEFRGHVPVVASELSKLDMPCLKQWQWEFRLLRLTSVQKNTSSAMGKLDF
jgi:L-malate glycosyltransferase